MPPKFKWRGKKVEQRIARASMTAINVTMAACVIHAKGNTPVLTGTAQGSIQLRPAVTEGRRIVGRWGSYNVDYFIWLEIGARGRPGHFMLRRAADREYPKLTDRIREAL